MPNTGESLYAMINACGLGWHQTNLSLTKPCINSVSAVLLHTLGWKKSCLCGNCYVCAKPLDWALTERPVKAPGKIMDWVEGK